jgi:hypothetical protein
MDQTTISAMARPSKIYPNLDSWFENIPSGTTVSTKTTSTFARPSKIYPKWDSWFENIPSDNSISKMEYQCAERIRQIHR